MHNRRRRRFGNANAATHQSELGTKLAVQPLSEAAVSIETEEHFCQHGIGASVPGFVRIRRRHAFEPDADHGSACGGYDRADGRRVCVLVVFQLRGRSDLRAVCLDRECGWLCDTPEVDRVGALWRTGALVDCEHRDPAVEPPVEHERARRVQRRRVVNFDPGRVLAWEDNDVQRVGNKIVRSAVVRHEGNDGARTREDRHFIQGAIECLPLAARVLRAIKDVKPSGARRKPHRLARKACEGVRLEEIRGGHELAAQQELVRAVVGMGLGGEGKVHGPHQRDNGGPGTICHGKQIRDKRDAELKGLLDDAENLCVVHPGAPLFKAGIGRVGGCRGWRSDAEDWRNRSELSPSDKELGIANALDRPANFGGPIEAAGIPCTARELGKGTKDLPAGRQRRGVDNSGTPMGAKPRVRSKHNSPLLLVTRTGPISIQERKRKPFMLTISLHPPPSTAKRYQGANHIPLVSSSKFCIGDVNFDCNDLFVFLDWKAPRHLARDLGEPNVAWAKGGPCGSSGEADLGSGETHCTLQFFGSFEAPGLIRRASNDPRYRDAAGLAEFRSSEVY